MTRALSFLALLSAWMALPTCCAHRPPPPAPVAPPNAACVLPPAPPALSVRFAGPEDGCDPKWTACLDNANALQLERVIRAREAWISEAVSRCGTYAKGPRP